MSVCGRPAPRQDWLHRCILKLTPPAGERPEFYHYPRRGPTLRQVAQLRAGGSAGFRAMLRSENGLDGKLVPINVQMYLWRPHGLGWFAPCGPI